MVLDRSTRFVVGAAKTWVMLGARTPEEVTAERARLLPGAVELVRAEVQAFEPARREVKTSAGAFTADYVVLALGAELDMGAVPGLDRAAHTFYTLEGATSLREAFAQFRGGRLLILIPRIPFQCPPGPYEAAILLHHALERRDLRGKTDFEFWTVEKAPMSTAGPDMGKMIVSELQRRGIGFHPQKKAVAVDGARRIVRFEDGTETGYDLLIAIPPHRVPKVAVEAGLADGAGWVAVDPRTLEVKTVAGEGRVFAVGDLTGLPLPGRFDPSTPLSLPKAGIFAAAEGEIVASRIAASIARTSSEAAFDGRGFCYLEVGGGLAMRADGSFFQMPYPSMSAQPPDESQYRDKVAWVQSWLNPQS